MCSSDLLQGYPDASVRGSVEMDGATVGVRFTLIPGDRKRVGAVRVVGNVITDAPVILRELALREGDLISRDKMLRSQHRLYRLGVFRSVRVSYRPLDSAEDPSLQLLEVRVDEAPPLSARVGLGYDTDRGLQGNLSTAHLITG